MDLVSAIGLISSFVTLEEAGRSWILIIKDKIKRKEIDINNWDSDDPLVQVCLDRFKTDMGDKYKDHIFSKEEIQDIIRGFFEQNRELRIGNEEKKQMTQIIEDILYAYNEYAKSLMSSGERTLHNTLSSDFSKIAEYVKNTIYEKANNILLLSIIESIGMNYQKEMPGYALELASSMELIYFDIHRSGEFISNPTKELLEKQIMLSMGVPEITRRYEKDEKCACNLQQYFANSYLCGDEGIKNRCHVILDYLYSIYDEKTYPNENLQIQKMDFRDAAMTAIDEKTIMIEPQIKGEAQKIVKNNEDENEPLLKMNEILNRLISDINEKKADADQIVSVIDTLCEKMKGDYRIEIQFESILVTLIASALIMPDVTDEQRNKLVNEWIRRVKKIFLNQSYVAEVNMVIALWEQLNKDINNDLKQQILLMILESIINDDNSGLISQIAELTKYFLAKNKNYASRIFNTIIMLAEDEMNHQKFNAAFIKENRNDADLSVRIRGDIVRFRMVESQDQVKHEMTKQEAQALVKYNDDIKNHRWASKPQIRKYDKVYNGKLRIVFGERSYIRDNDSEKLEDRLGDILVTLYEKAEENRIVREAREEAERKRVEEARRREENRQRKEQEIRLVKELVNKAEDYRIAKEIREYIQAMIDSGNEDITPAWIEWARKKADWYDPSIATEDEYLGKRQHEKNAEEKEKSLQDSIRKSWYW